MLHPLKDLNQTDAQEKDPAPPDVLGGGQFQILAADEVIKDERKP
jgi:hypothetical protein